MKRHSTILSLCFLAMICVSVPFLIIFSNLAWILHALSLGYNHTQKQRIYVGTYIQYMRESLLHIYI